MRLRGFATAFAIALLLAACGGRAAPQGSGPQVVDDAGHSLTFARPPQRIVSLAPSATDLVLALDMGGRLVGADRFSYDQFRLQGVKRLGGLETSAEDLLALSPDLVLAPAGTRTDTYRKAGLPVLTLDPHDLDGIYHDLEMLGSALGAEQRAQAAVAAMKGTVDPIVRKAAAIPDRDRVSVYYEVWYGKQIVTAGPRSFIGDLIAKAGGRNVVADTAGPWPQVSAEQIVAAAPDVILGTAEDGALAELRAGHRPGWENVPAVRGGRVYTLPDDLVSQPDTNAARALAAIAADLYPDRFRP